MSTLQQLYNSNALGVETVKRTHRLAVWLLAVACMFVSPVAGAQVTISHLSQSSHGAAWAEWLKQTAEQFTRENPDIEVEIRVAPGGAAGILQQYQVAVAGDAAPDVLDMNSTAFPLMDTYFLDLHPYLKRDGIIDTIFPVLMRMASNNKGEIWGLPAMMQVIPTYFNIDILESAGLPTPYDLGANWNWDAVLDIAKRTTRDLNGDGKTDQYGTDRMYMRWYEQVAQAGGMHYDKWVFPSKAQFNQAPVMKAFDYISTFFTMGYEFPYRAAGHQQQYFWFGKSALTFADGPGALGPTQLGAASFKFDIAPQPQGPVNNAAVCYPASYLQIDRNTKHPDAAYKWISYLVTNQTAMTNMVKLTRNIPTSRKGVAIYGQAGGSSLPKHWAVFFDHASSPYAVGTFAHKNTQVTTIQSKYLDELWRGNASVQTTVELLDQHLNAILNQ
jgi:multiple sugar transport system substrate-binding protein